MDRGELEAAFAWVVEVCTRQLAQDLTHLKAWENQSLNRALASLPAQWGELRPRLEAEFRGFGPLEHLIHRPSVTEIMVNGRSRIHFEDNGAHVALGDGFLSDFTYRNFIDRVCERAAIVANLQTPFADGAFDDFRVHLTLPPLVNPEPILCLRRHPQCPWTLEKLEAVGWADASALAILKGLIARKKNVLVLGPTGSGKTSVLNACLQELPESERVIVIEDCDEIRIPNDISLKLLTRADAQGVLRDYDQSALLKLSLRLKPDRLVVGEVRGAEAKDLLMALSTGHRGGLSSLHAESPRQALLRLEMLIQMGAPQWQITAIRNLIHLSLDALVVVGRDENGRRRLQGIYGLSSLEESGFLVDPMWTAGSSGEMAIQRSPSTRVSR